MADASASTHIVPGRQGTALLGVGAALFLILATLLCFLPGQSTVPPLDRDEPRYTQATKQMVESGDYVRIRFQDAPRNKKPIGIHWLQAGAVWLSGEGADAPLWVYRLPSLIGAATAVLLTAWAARAILPLPAALTAAALLGSTIILGVEARLAKTDAVLLATVVLMQGALVRVWLAEAKGLAMPLLFWTGLALGILVKGPIAPMIAALTVAVLAWRTGSRLLPKLRPLIGLVILAALCLPWFVAIWRATDGAFFTAALGRDFLGKAAGGQEGHWAPPLTHLALFFVVGWPLAPFALAAARLWLTERGPAFLFAAAWAIPSWLVFEVTPTKLPHYTLPLLPAVAIATVAALYSRPPGSASRALAGLLLLVVPVGVVGAALGAPVYLLSAMGRAPDLSPVVLQPMTVLALLPILLAFVSALAIWRGWPMLSFRVAVPGIVAAVAAQAIVWGALLPALWPIWASPRLVEAAREVAPCDRPRIASVGGYNEPSLIFLAGTDTALVNAAEAVDLAREGCVVIAARARAVDEVRAAAATAGVALDEAAVVEGFNISKGDPVALTLFVRSGGRAAAPTDTNPRACCIKS